MTGTARLGTSTALTARRPGSSVRVAGGSRATVAQVLMRWLETADLKMTTGYPYEWYVTQKILPALASVTARKVSMRDARSLPR